MRSLTTVLGILLVLALMCLYQVSGSYGKAREGFEATGEKESEEAETDVDGRVFSAWMGVHGVPPSPQVSKFYADVANVEELDIKGIEAKMRADSAHRVSPVGDSESVAATAKPVESPSVDETSTKSETEATDEDMDSEVVALREKMVSAKNMSKPVRTSPQIAERARIKLRQIAGQVAELASQFEKGEDDNKRPEPKGIEQFISFR